MRKFRERAGRAAAFAAVLGVGVATIALTPHAQLYPALSLPSFAGSPLREGALTVVRPVLTVDFAAADDAEVDYRLLLPPGTPNPINVFRSFAYDDADVDDPSTRAWLSERLAALYPGEQIVGLDIAWTRFVYRAEDRGLISAEIVRHHSIPLGAS